MPRSVSSEEASSPSGAHPEDNCRIDVSIERRQGIINRRGSQTTGLKHICDLRTAAILIGLRAMWDFPLFPEQASTVAGRVDALYYFLVGAYGILRNLDRRGRGLFRRQVPAGKQGRQKPPSLGKCHARGCLDRRPAA